MAAIIVSRCLQSLLHGTVPQARSVAAVSSMKSWCQLSNISWSVTSRVLVPKNLSTTAVLNTEVHNL